MEKARGWMVKTLERAGSSAFRLLSGLEDRIRPTSIVNWLKLGLLGLLITLISACGKKPEQVITCYKPVMTTPTVSDVVLSPNPTRGADSVKVRATAKVFRPNLKGNHITSAYLNLGDDENYIPLKAADGEFSDTLEVVEGYFDVSELEPCSTWIYLNVNSSKDSQGMFYYQLIVTDKTAEEE
jgi:hypothetical protein